MVPPAEVVFDALYPEAWLIAAVDGPRASADWLDPTLNALATTDPEVFADVTRAGSLVRAMVLRAELAEKMGDRATAARWAHVVVTLWSGADSFLKPAVERMEHLAN